MDQAAASGRVGESESEIFLDGDLRREKKGGGIFLSKGN